MRNLAACLDLHVTPPAPKAPRSLCLVHQEAEAEQGAAKPAAAGQRRSLPTGKARVQLLYEEYISLQKLRKIWESPVTDKPVFAAALQVCAEALPYTPCRRCACCHNILPLPLASQGIELGFLLASEFIADGRK